MDPDSPINKNFRGSSSSDKAALGRRIFARARRMKPGLFDGDLDGFVYNPATGRDDLPAPRRSMIPRSGKKKRRVVFPNQPVMRSGMMQSRTIDDEPDPLEELLRGAGVGVPNAADRMSAAAREMAERRRQQGAGFSPVDVNRKKVRIDGISRNTFLSMMDDLIDYTKTLKDNPVEERDNKRIWKLLFVMQKLENLNGLTQSGNGVDLNISEDELKRLYKGLQSLIDNVGQWSDNSDAQDLYSQIKKLYKRPWSEIGEQKSLSSDIEVKIIGSRIGRRARRAIRSKFTRSRIDGDGDGMRTNPLTGEDNIPVVSAPDVQKPKKPLTAADVGLMSMRTRGRLYQQSREAEVARKFRSQSQNPSPDDQLQNLISSFANYMSSPRSDEDVIDWFQEGFFRVDPSTGQAKIKDRSWEVFEKRVKSINEDIEKRFGKLIDLEDFEDAFTELNPAVSILNFDEDDFGDSERGFMTGLLWMMFKFPNRFDRSSKIEIKHKGSRPSGGAATDVVPRFRGKYANKPTKVFPGERVIFLYYGDKTHLDRSMPPPDFIDGVSAQMAKAYLKSLDGSEDPSEVVKTTIQLQSLGTGIHEGVHALHHLAANEDALLEGLTPNEVDKVIDDFINSDPDGVFDSYMFMAGHQVMFERLKVGIQLAAEDPDFEDYMIAARDEAVNRGSMLEAMQIELAIAGRREAIEQVRQLREVLSANPNKYPNITAALSTLRAVTERDLEQFVGKLFLENKDEAVELMTDLMAAEQAVPASIIRSAFRGTPSELAAAQFQIVRKKLWDDLNPAEISALRSIWKYVSKYAKDKNSYYEGQSFGASVEGAAEGMLLRIMGFGLPPEKVSPLALAAFDKWLKWIAGKDY